MAHSWDSHRQSADCARGPHGPDPWSPVPVFTKGTAVRLVLSDTGEGTWCSYLQRWVQRPVKVDRPSSIQETPQPASNIASTLETDIPRSVLLLKMVSILPRWGGRRSFRATRTCSNGRQWQPHPDVWCLQFFFHFPLLLFFLVLSLPTAGAQTAPAGPTISTHGRAAHIPTAGAALHLQDEGGLALFCFAVPPASALKDCLCVYLM